MFMWNPFLEKLLTNYWFVALYFIYFRKKTIVFQLIIDRSKSVILRAYFTNELFLGCSIDVQNGSPLIC